MDVQEILTSEDQDFMRMLETVARILFISSPRGLVGSSYLWPDLPLLKDPPRTGQFSSLACTPFISKRPPSDRFCLPSQISSVDAKEPFKTCLPASCSDFKVK